MRYLLTSLLCVLTVTLTAQTTYDVTFTVNMASETTSEQGVCLAGGGPENFGDPGENVMSDADGDDIWSITVSVPEGYSTYYAFTNGICPTWGCKENLAGLPCGDPANYNHRFLDPVMSDMTISTCFGQCSADGSCDELSDVNVTFSVNMNDQPVVNDVYITGQVIDEWCGTCEIMDDADGDGIYTYTTELSIGTHEYKFNNGGWDGSESLESEEDGACTITTVDGDNEYVNRVLELTSGDELILDVVCFNSCDACDTEMETNSVFDIIANSDVHNTLETAIVAAGLDETLSNDGPFTVFAPTDDAFSIFQIEFLDIFNACWIDTLGIDTVQVIESITIIYDSVYAEPIGEWIVYELDADTIFGSQIQFITVQGCYSDTLDLMLSDFLLGHVLPGTIMSTDFSDEMMVTTISGNEVLVNIDEGNVMIGNAIITVSDIEADNGVLHVIDAILFSQSVIPGCTDDEAVNYNPEATENDFSCIYEGCIIEVACNYNPEASIDDGSCIFFCSGCTDETACNYDSYFLQDDGSCTYLGCIDMNACNYDANAGCGDDNCQYFDECGECGGISTLGCNEPSACNYDINAGCDDMSCVFSGCMDDGACNYDVNAGCDDGACEYESCTGCMYELACNYDSEYTIADNESCEFGTCPGCTDLTACNYNPTVSEDDGSCEFCSCNDCSDGCTNTEACNYDSNAISDDGSCLSLDECGVCGGEGILEGACDCEGNVLDASGICGGDCEDDYNSNGVCDDQEVYGCTYIDSPSFDASATVDDGSCVYYIIDNFCPADLDYNGTVGTPDLLLFLSAFGGFCG